MKRLSKALLVAGLSLGWLWASQAHAGTVTFSFGGAVETITTNANVDAGLGKLLARENLVRAAQTPPLPPLTVEQLMKQHVVNLMQTKRQDANVVETGDFCAVFPTLTGAQRTQIISLGGGSSPCP